MNFNFLNYQLNNPLLKIVLTLFLYFISSKLIKKTIDSVFLNINKKVKKEELQAKTQTIRSLLKNSIDLVLFFITLLIILSQFGINIIPILTGAGVLGLAISFGAQSLVKDIISGFFILIEDQFNVGDHVKVGSFEGKVIKLTLRMTILKDKEGNLIYIPNSQISSVIKFKKEGLNF